MAALISVIIPARDSEAVIAPCLESLLAQTRKPDEIIVVDDASTDRTAQKVRTDYPAVRLVTLDMSLGFAGACIAGLAASTGQWIALVNSDVEAHPSWLDELMVAAGQGPRVGMIASRVLLADPPGAVDSLGLMIKRSGMALLRGHGEPDRPDDSLPRFEEVFGPAGSAALYKKEMLDDAGFFAPDFANYYEDVDLAFRARWKGWTCILANRARAVHRHSYTMDRININKRYFLQRNRLRVILRNWPLAWIMLDSPLVAAYDLASIALALGEGNVRGPIQARLDLLRSLSRDLAARRGIMRPGRFPAEPLQRWLTTDHAPAPEPAPGREGAGP
ncbi:MAG TPA: glycosyltransferase family 2 protein [bacterium]|nr:glycosyltransferase family 2 protein [bacterium]